MVISITVILFAILLIEWIEACPGICVFPGECRGKVIGFCGSHTICCEAQNKYGNIGNYEMKPGPFEDRCGGISDAKISLFRSPLYPRVSSGSLVCKFDLNLNPQTAGIKLEFLDLKMDASPIKLEDINESPYYTVCDSDMFFIKGFSDWSPDPRCGNLKGFSTIIEREVGQKVLSIVFVMSSSEYKWNFRFTQIYQIEVEETKKTSSNLLGGLHYGESRQHPVERLFSPNNNTNEKLKSTLLIAGGQEASKSSLPWQVSLQAVGSYKNDELCGKKQRKGIHFCGGSIVGDYSILTAAHCFFSTGKYPHPVTELTRLRVVVGEHDLCDSEEVPYTEAYGIESVTYHYNYLSLEILNDVALIKLKKRIKFSEGVMPIPLALKEINVMTLKPILSGWGSLGFGDDIKYPTKLQETSELKVLPDAECSKNTMMYLGIKQGAKLNRKFIGALTSGICTQGKTPNVEAGYGDSGGPLAGLDVEGRPWLLGVVSHKREDENVEKSDNNMSLNYFPKVSYYSNWIIMAML